MWLLGFGKKVDSNIKKVMKFNIKKRIPVVVCFKGNGKSLENKIIYNGGKINHKYINASAFSCEISPLGIDRLTETPEVLYVFSDYKASLCLKTTIDGVGIKTARISSLTGKNIGIGIIDSGVYPHPDLTFQRNSIAFFKDLVNGLEKPYDDNGHGTFMCGCIASSGYSSSKEYQGAAPDSNLCVIKAFDESGNGFISDIIKGIDILIEEKQKYNIRIICLPFEFPYINHIKINPLEEIINKAVQNNISVFAPSGNLGPQPYSIYFPGNMENVITVAGISYKRGYSNPSIADFSGRGPLLNSMQKPDISLPCTNITSLASDISYYPTSRIRAELKTPYASKTGTSIACALASGISSLVLEKNPELTFQDLKSVLGVSTISIGENKFSQGKGMLLLDKILK